jgi:enterobactin synthetase component D
MRGVLPPFTTLFVRPHAFGLLAGVSLPSERAPVPDEVLARLPEAERVAAGAHQGFRQQEWVGARLAWHAAASALGLGVHPLLSGADREPLPPPGVAVSLTHKRDLALALVGDAAEGALGLDLEGDGRERLRIEPRVLSAAESAHLDTLPPERRWLELMVRFAVKEAIYKAVHARLRRYVAFDEAEVEVELGQVRVSDLLADLSQVEVVTVPRARLHSVPAPQLECVAEHAGGRVLAAVRARWA